MTIVNCQLTIVNCQLTIDNCQLSIDNCQLTIANCQLSIDNCQLSIVLDRVAVSRAAVDRAVDLARTLLSGAQGPGPRAGDPIGT